MDTPLNSDGKTSLKPIFDRMGKLKSHPPPKWQHSFLKPSKGRPLKVECIRRGTGMVHTFQFWRDTAPNVPETNQCATYSIPNFQDSFKTNDFQPQLSSTLLQDNVSVPVTATTPTSLLSESDYQNFENFFDRDDDIDEILFPGVISLVDETKQMISNLYYSNDPESVSSLEDEPFGSISQPMPWPSPLQNSEIVFEDERDTMVKAIFEGLPLDINDVGNITPIHFSDFEVQSNMDLFNTTARSQSPLIFHDLKPSTIGEYGTFPASTLVQQQNCTPHQQLNDNEYYLKRINSVLDDAWHPSSLSSNLNYDKELSFKWNSPVPHKLPKLDRSNSIDASQHSNTFTLENNAVARPNENSFSFSSQCIDDMIRLQKSMSFEDNGSNAVDYVADTNDGHNSSLRFTFEEQPRKNSFNKAKIPHISKNPLMKRFLEDVTSCNEELFDNTPLENNNNQIAFVSSQSSAPDCELCFDEKNAPSDFQHYFTQNTTVKPQERIFSFTDEVEDLF